MTATFTNSLKMPCRATTRFGAEWPLWLSAGLVRVDAGTEVIVRHGAADQDGWDGGVVCQVKQGWVVIEVEGLRFA